MSIEPTVEPGVVEPKKSSKSGGLTVLLILLLLAAIGLGAWGYMQTNSLKATVAARADLQIKYDSLTQEKDSISSDLETATADLEKAKADLEKAKEDIGAAQADLVKSQENAAAMRGKMDKALQYVGVVSGIFVNAEKSIQTEARVKEIGDKKLTELFDAYLDSLDPADFQEWFKHLFITVSDLLK